VNDDLKELLRDKADEMRIGPGIPQRVVRRSRRRRALSTALAGTVAVGLAFGAFVGARVALNQGGESPGQVPATQPPATEPPFAPTATHELWFTLNGSLFVTRAQTEDTPQGALGALLDGPTDEESGVGVASSIPAGTELKSYSLNDGLARVDFSTHVESDPLADAQVVYTLTGFPDVQQVQINGQEGGPLTRADLKGQLPAILLEHPSIGDTVSSPVTISGTADVFEAVVSIQIVAGEGTKVADTTTMADCSSTCPGPYSVAVAFSVPSETTGTIVVFERSAKDGSPINEVRIPVTLEPGGAPPTSSGFDGIWPADSDAQLAQLQAEAAAGQANWALKAETTATEFAAQVANWDPSKIAVHAVQPGGDQSYVELWNTGMGSYSSQISLNVQLRKDGDVWIVRHVEDGLFDLQDPSIRQDVIVGATQSISGVFSQAPAGWTATAVLMPAGNALNPSAQETAADVPISGNGFSGNIDVPATSGGDVELIVSVSSGNGETLGLWARRLSTAG
jgi:hypothetical protein